jgi:hypothetical protein
MYDASDRKSIRAAEKAAARLDAERIEFLRAALSTIQGRTWFYHFLADCQVFAIDPTFDSPRDYFALGQRNVGMRIFAEIKTHCPDRYIAMEQQEHARIIALDTAAERSSRQDSGRDVEGRGADDTGPDDPTDNGDET